MSNRDLVESWFVEIWENGNMSVLDDMLDPSLDGNDLLDGLPAPRNDFPILVETVHMLTGPLKVEFLLFFESDDWTSTRYVMTAQGADGKTPLKVEGIALIRFRENKIVELTSKFDSFTLFEQLGQLPPEALTACLSGQKLTWI